MLGCVYWLLLLTKVFPSTSTPCLFIVMPPTYCVWCVNVGVCCVCCCLHGLSGGPPPSPPPQTHTHTPHTRAHLLCLLVAVLPHSRCMVCAGHVAAGSQGLPRWPTPARHVWPSWHGPTPRHGPPPTWLRTPWHGRTATRDARCAQLGQYCAAYRSAVRISTCDNAPCLPALSGGGGGDCYQKAATGAHGVVTAGRFRYR
jgi:hypothetical protein